MALTAQEEQALRDMYNEWQIAKPQLIRLRKLILQLFETLRERQAIDPATVRKLLDLYEIERPAEAALDNLGITKGIKAP